MPNSVGHHVLIFTLEKFLEDRKDLSKFQGSLKQLLIGTTCGLLVSHYLIRFRFWQLFLPDFSFLLRCRRSLALRRKRHQLPLHFPQNPNLKAHRRNPSHQTRKVKATLCEIEKVEDPNLQDPAGALEGQIHASQKIIP